MILDKVDKLVSNISRYGICEDDNINNIIRSAELCDSEIIADWYLTLREAVSCSEYFIDKIQPVAFGVGITIEELVRLIVLRSIIMDFVSYSPYKCSIVYESIHYIETLNYNESNNLIKLIS